MRKLRVAIIGISHIHVITLSRDFNKHKDLYEIVGMADVPPFTKEELATKLKLNIPDDVELKLFDNYRYSPLGINSKECFELIKSREYIDVIPISIES